MDYIIPIKKWGDTKVGSRGKLSVVRIVYDMLDGEHMDKLSYSCFGKLLEMREFNLSGKLMNSLYLRRIAHQSENEELWFGIGNERVCFSLLDFTLITGLSPGVEEDFKNEIPENRLLKEYFEDNKSITPYKLKEAFENAEKMEDKYKLGLVYIYESVLRAKEPGTYIEVVNLAIVDDLDLFNIYPWGRKCYAYTIHEFLRNDHGKIKNSLWGFPIALQVWAFECIPHIQEAFDASKAADKIPRMCSWKSMLTPSYEKVENVLTNSEIRVTPLEPTPEEIEGNHMKVLFEDRSSEKDKTSSRTMDENDMHHCSPLPNVVSPPQDQLLKQILDAIEALDKKFDALDKKIDALENKIDSLNTKVLMPLRVYLLRGNHETKFCTSVYGFEKEVSVKYGDDGKHVYRKCLGCFQKLPLASVIAGGVYTAHGGLFRGGNIAPSKNSKKIKGKVVHNPEAYPLILGSLDELAKARRFVLDPPWEGQNVIPGDVLWSDPSMSDGLSPNVGRGIGLLWGRDCTEEFLKKSNLKLIIRSHEGPDARYKRSDLGGMDLGYTIDHEVESGKLITLFSAPDYPQFQATEHRFNNKASYIVLEPPNFDTSNFHSFEAVTPRPKVNPYYDFENAIDSDEELDLGSMVTEFGQQQSSD